MRRRADLDGCLCLETDADDSPRTIAMYELTRLLILYTWAGVGVLILILYRIARFYQLSANERSYYRWFLLPLALFVLAALRYAWVADFAGDPWGDGLLMLGGGGLLLLSYHLLQLMTGGRS